MSVEGGKAPTLFHAYRCECGLWVRSVDFAAVEKIANGHARKCHKASVQMTQTVPFVIPDEGP